MKLVSHILRQNLFSFNDKDNQSCNLKIFFWDCQQIFLDDIFVCFRLENHFWNVTKLNWKVYNRCNKLNSKSVNTFLHSKWDWISDWREIRSSVRSSCNANIFLFLVVKVKLAKIRPRKMYGRKAQVFRVWKGRR